MGGITASFEGTDLRTIQRLNGAAPSLIEEIRRRLGIEGVKLQSHIVLNKLQGQVLNHRSGKLAGSIRALPVAETATGFEEEVQGGGGPAWYGRIHNYGGVFSYLRRNQKRLFGTFVIAHYPRRNFMESSLEERRASIVESLRLAMNREGQ